MMFLPVTSLLAAFLALMLVALSLPVTLRRIKIDAPIGDGADETLRRRIRAQGNFIEYVPIGLICLGLVEASSAASWMVLSLAGTLVVGRVLHAIGMLIASTPLRGAGMVLTYAMILVSAGRLIIVVLS